jgi:hypothetical protein
MVLRGWMGLQWGNQFLHIFVFEKHEKNLLKIFSIANRPISIKLDKIYPYLKGIQVYSNKRSGPLQKGDNHKNAK